MRIYLNRLRLFFNEFFKLFLIGFYNPLRRSILLFEIFAKKDITKISLIQMIIFLEIGSNSQNFYHRFILISARIISSCITNARINESYNLRFDKKNKNNKIPQIM